MPRRGVESHSIQRSRFDALVSSGLELCAGSVGTWSAHRKVMARSAAAKRQKRQSMDVLVDARDPLRAAKLAGLRYVSDGRRGIGRKRAGKSFSYTATDGTILRDKTVLARIRALVIPPAWTEVWISPHPHGHLQATGRDARGRKQYRYHPRWREVRDEAKYDRLVPFAETLPRIRARTDEHLQLPGLPRAKVLMAPLGK